MQKVTFVDEHQHELVLSLQQKLPVLVSGLEQRQPELHGDRIELVRLGNVAADPNFDRRPGFDDHRLRFFRIKLELKQIEPK